MGELADKAKGAINVAAGKAKQVIGEQTDSARLQAEGHGQQAKGHLQNAKGTVEGALGNKV